MIRCDMHQVFVCTNNSFLPFKIELAANPEYAANEADDFGQIMANPPGLTLLHHAVVTRSVEFCKLLVAC